jgi:hypothetical protein
MIAHCLEAHEPFISFVEGFLHSPIDVSECFLLFLLYPPDNHACSFVYVFLSLLSLARKLWYSSDKSWLWWYGSERAAGRAAE